MPGGYDGSVRVDTRMDTDGFVKGTARIDRGMKKLMTSIGIGLAQAGGRVALLAGVIGKVGTAFLGAAVDAARFASRLIGTLFESMSSTSAYREQVVGLQDAFAGLKGAFYTAAASLLSALAPALMVIIQWLVKAINFAAMFIAALAGQKTVAQYTAGSIGKAASGACKLAKNTKQAEKAARGALAAFDEINVLRKDEANEDFDTGGGGGGVIPVSFEEVQVPENFLATVWQKIKEAIAGVLASAWETLKLLWEIIKIKAVEWMNWIAENVGGKIITFVTNVATWIGEAAVTAWEWITSTFGKLMDWIDTAIGAPMREFVNSVAVWAAEAWEWLQAVWQGAGPWFQQKVIDPIVGWFSTAWENIKTWAKIAWDWIVEKWQGAGTWFGDIIGEITTWFSTAWTDIETWVGNAWDWVVETWQGAAKWFETNVTDPIAEGFRTALDWIEEKWDILWQGVQNFAKGGINGVIDLINGMLQAVAVGLNTIIEGLNKIKIKIPDLDIFGGLAGFEWSLNLSTVSAPQIPRLARGAVIPPNAEFLALLGDQRAGRNLETPEALLRQIVQEEVGRVQADIRIEFGGTLGALVRELKPHIDRETVRVGRSLVAGGSA